MADLDEVIETGAGADHRVSRRSSVNRAVRTHFDVVFKNDSTKLGDGEKSICGGGESKPFLSDPGAGIDVNTRPQKRMA